MFRRGLCLLLVLLVASAHLPMQFLFAADSEDHSPPVRQVCPCNPAAEKCECCCSSGGSKPQPEGASMRSCSCDPHDSLLLAPPTYFADPWPLPYILEPVQVGRLHDSAVLYASIFRSPDSPPPR